MGLLENDVEVTVIEMGNRMLPLQLDQRASKLTKNYLENTMLI